MTFAEAVSHVHRLLYDAGFETLNELYPLGRVSERKKVIDCILAARRGEYEVIYAEVESNQEGIAGDLARSHLTPCLVITNIGGSYAFTVLDYDAPRNTPRTSKGNRRRLEAIIDEIREASGDMWEANQHIARFIGTMNMFAK